MPHHEHTPEVLNHEAAPMLDAAAGDLRALGGLPVRGSVVLDYKTPEAPGRVGHNSDNSHAHEIVRVESRTERERREAYEEYHERLRIPEALRHQAMEALRRTLAACREEFVGFDEQLVAQATARLMAIIDDTPLPPELQKRRNPNASIPAVEWVVGDRIHRKLLNVQDGPMYEALNYPYDTHAIHDAALEAMRHHPLYQAFEATISHSEKPDSRKRTPFELQTALAQAEQEVKRRHGISPQDDLRLHHGARRAFERQAWQIEDEEIPHTTSSKDDAHSKAIEFFITILPEQERSEFRRSLGVLKAGWPKDMSGQGDVDRANRLMKRMSMAIDDYEDTSATGSEEVDVLVKRFMNGRFRKALSQEVQNRSRPSSDYLLTAGSMGSLELRVRDSFYHVSSWQSVPETYAERVRQMSMGADLPTPVQYALDAQDYGLEPEPVQVVVGGGIGLLSGRNFYIRPNAQDSTNYDFSSLEAQAPLARVHYTDAFPAGVPRAMRLTQPTQMPDMSDVSRVQNHMVINPKNGNLPAAGDAYTVAGFKLEWASNGSLHFAYDADHDPYTPAKTPLPEGSIDQLVAVYKEAGLDELARLVDQASIRTVAELEHTLKQGADYAHKGNSLRQTTTTLGALAKAYKTDEGRLSYQCTGAAQLLKLSLQELYGPNSVSIISSSVLAPSANTIGAIGHAQVKFVSPEDSRVYYLDATPSGSEIDVAEAVEDETETDEPTHSQAPVEESVEWLEEAKTLFEEHKRENEAGQTKEYTKAEADAVVTTIRESRLLPMVGSWLNIQPTNKKSRDELYRKLLELQQGDPLRSTLELTHQIPAGTANVSELPRLKALLDTIAEHPANSPIFKRIKRYSKTQLAALGDIVSDVEAAYAAVSKSSQ